jgi:hypothetical protein
MAAPSDLISHYSGLAFQTRIAALAFVGAAIGAEVAWAGTGARSAVRGAALLLIIGSLAELNRRYTWSYLSACRASVPPNRVKSEPATADWNAFIRMNEGPWGADLPSGHTSRGAELPSTKRVPRSVNRFLLSWGTYLPGILAGVYLVRRDGTATELWTALVAALALLAWWFGQSALPPEPARYLRSAQASRSSGGQAAEVDDAR